MTHSSHTSRITWVRELSLLHDTKMWLSKSCHTCEWVMCDMARAMSHKCRLCDMTYISHLCMAQSSRCIVTHMNDMRMVREWITWVNSCQGLCVTCHTYEWYENGSWVDNLSQLLLEIMCDLSHIWMTWLDVMYRWCIDRYELMWHDSSIHSFLDGYCSTVQGLLDWFEVDLGFTELLFIQIDFCVMCVFFLYSPVSLSSCSFFGHPALPPPRGGSASRVIWLWLDISWCDMTHPYTDVKCRCTDMTSCDMTHPYTDVKCPYTDMTWSHLCMDESCHTTRITWIVHVR